MMINEHLKHQTRRHFFQNCGLGLGKLGLASAMAGGFDNLLHAAASQNPIAPHASHYPAKAKRVIYLFMAGGPSQLELFEDKPKLRELDGHPLPPSVVAGQRLAFIQPDAAVLAPRFPYKAHGESGAVLSDRLPFLAQHVDDIAFIKSMNTSWFNHSPAQIFQNTGSGIPGRPAMGSWFSYGIGSEANDLPSFVVLKSGGNLSGGAAMWSAGFLPGSHAGVPFRKTGDPILHVSNPRGYDDRAQRDSLDLIQKFNHRELGDIGDPEIQTRINAYEMAWRMQSAAPELMDFSSESKATLEMYGADPGNKKKTFANNCLLARRLVERGTRFVQIYLSGWDHHSQVENGIKHRAREIDRPCAGLLADLKSRGMLEDTLVIWGGEFGRTPMVEASSALGRTLGRDHHPRAFTMWMAGGGVKPGVTVGATDELGFNVIDTPVDVHDLHATIMHLMGLNHERLTFRFQGRDYRLTDVHGNVVKELLA